MSGGTGTTRSDPPRRDDGRCALPDCNKRLPTITARHRRYGGEALLSEPFCSTECCRSYHGTTLPKRSIWHRDHEIEDAA